MTGASSRHITPLPSRASGSGVIFAVAEGISVAEALEATVVKALYLLAGPLPHAPVIPATLDDR